MKRKVAFVTGASRGIGAEAAVALAQAGFDVAITARTVSEGEAQDYLGMHMPLPGSLEATAAAVKQAGGEPLCLKADILDSEAVVQAALATLDHFGQVDLLFNNAIYQGSGNQEPVLDVQPEQLQAIYQGNVFTPLILVQQFLPSMLTAGAGTIINMLSYTAFNDPPVPAAKGGWSFAYPSSKAALARMAGALRAEHKDAGLRIFNLEPGTVVTDVMRSAGVDEEVLARFKPCAPQSIAAVVAWLAEHEPRAEWMDEPVLRGPAIAKSLGVLDAPSLLGDNT